MVLVGDPKQLPPTVLSRAAEASNLAQSLFERLQQVGHDFGSRAFCHFLQSSEFFPNIFFGVLMEYILGMFVGSMHCQHSHMRWTQNASLLVGNPRLCSWEILGSPVYYLASL